MTPELDTERLGKKVALQHDVAEQTKRKLCDGNNEQITVPLPAASPPNKNQKHNMPDGFRYNRSLFDGRNAHIEKEKNPWLWEKMFESRFPHASGREEG